jgi:hypothetical protein
MKDFQVISFLGFSFSLSLRLASVFLLKTGFNSTPINSKKKELGGADSDQA